jgi:SulP family sulfate permease
VVAFSEKFDVQNDSKEAVIDFRKSRVADMSGIDALNELTERYHKAGKRLHLKHLSKDCRQLLKNAVEVIDVNILEDPIYPVAADK